MEISYGLVNLMYFMLCSEHWKIKGSRSNKRRKLLTCFTNSLFKVYNNLSLRETGPEVYNIIILRGNWGKVPSVIHPFISLNIPDGIFTISDAVLHWRLKYVKTKFENSIMFAMVIREQRYSRFCKIKLCVMCVTRERILTV